MKKLISIILFILISVFAMIFLSVTMGCKYYQSKPDLNETLDRKLPIACYYAQDCLYRNKANDDKSSCVTFMMECRAFLKFNKCRYDAPSGMSMDECWRYLNQK